MTRVCRPLVSLATLEGIWREKHSDPDILSSLQATFAQILVKPDHHLFLDMVKFVAMLLTDLYEKVDSEVLGDFVERFLIGAHFTASKYFDKDSFDQNRYLDCIAALLSVWTDCTKKEELIIPKIVVFTRNSETHVLDTILQSLNISGEIKCQLLDQITSLSNIDIYVKYTIAGRGYPKYRLHSQHPSEDAFRCWLLKHNIVTIRSVCEFVDDNKADNDLLSSMCRAFYTLPSTDTDISPQTGAREVEPDVMFFIDRGEKDALDNLPKNSALVNDDISNITKENVAIESITEEESKEEAMSVDSPDIDAALLAPTQELLSEHVADEEPQESEPCIKIRNTRKSRNKPIAPGSDVIVLKLPTSPAPEKHLDTETVCNSDTPLSTTLNEESLATLPGTASLRKRGRPRKISEESAVSVDSVASRTRQRAKVEQPLLQVISEEGTKVEVASTRKTAKTSARKKQTSKAKSTPKCSSSIKEGGIEERKSTPKCSSSIKEGGIEERKSTPKCSSSIKEGGIEERISESIDETPQIPVRKTRSRKLNV